MATGPMGIGVIVKPYPNPNPNPLGIEIRCKRGRLDEYIKNRFIPVLVFQIGINYFTSIFLFFLFVSFSHFPPFSQLGLLGHLAPATQPRGRGG